MLCLHITPSKFNSHWALKDMAFWVFWQTAACIGVMMLLVSLWDDCVTHSCNAVSVTQTLSVESYVHLLYVLSKSFNLYLSICVYMRVCALPVLFLQISPIELLLRWGNRWLCSSQTGWADQHCIPSHFGWVSPHRIHSIITHCHHILPQTVFSWRNSSVAEYNAE